MSDLGDALIAALDAAKEDKGCEACWRCVPRYQFMRLCPICGCKRCPHANDHDNECTGSNEPGQSGSAYEFGSGAASARRLGWVL